MTEYHLIAYEPYESPSYLFSGSESDLKDFIQKNVGINIHKTVTGREIKSPSVCGYLLDDLEVVIQGPDIRTYFE